MLQVRSGVTIRWHGLYIRHGKKQTDASFSKRRMAMLIVILLSLAAFIGVLYCCLIMGSRDDDINGRG